MNNEQRLNHKVTKAVIIGTDKLPDYVGFELEDCGYVKCLETVDGHEHLYEGDVILEIAGSLPVVVTDDEYKALFEKTT